MRYGLVDIGSNTIRAVVYDVKDYKYKKMFSEKDYAEIISYIADNRLTEEGILRLCQTINRMKLIFELVECEEISYFATSSLRNISNSQAVLEQVDQNTGVKIDVISGDEEAYYDYVSLKNYLAEERALGLDLGGGSGQLFYYENNDLLHAASYRIGCLRLYNSLVEGLLPTKEECKRIVKIVRAQIEQGEDFDFEGIDTLYVMGGTGRAMAKLHNYLIGQEKLEFPYTIPVSEFTVFEALQDKGSTSGIKLINKLFPERLCSIIPGILSITTVAKMLGIKQICVIKEGVREGYLLHHVLGKGDKK